MTIQQLLYAIEIEQTGSINIAAANLHTSQSNLSMAIKELEKKIGYPIFKRTNKGTILTNEGGEFLTHAKRVIFEYERLNETCLKKTSEAAIELKISSQHYAFLNEAFIIFLAQNPNSNYNCIIKETTTDKIIKDVYRKNCDVAFIVLSDYNRNILKEIFKKKNIVFNVLDMPAPHVFLNKNHPLAKTNSIHLDELDDYPNIIFDQDNNSVLAEEPIIQDNHRKTIYVNDRGTCMGFIGKSSAYNIGTGYLSKEMKDSGVVAIPLKDCSLKQEIACIHLKDYRPSRYVKQFINIVNDLLQNNSLT